MGPNSGEYAAVWSHLPPSGPPGSPAGMITFTWSIHPMHGVSAVYGVH